nr:hypothetical protein CFP56_52319 [Quercus suber]
MIPHKRIASSCAKLRKSIISIIGRPIVGRVLPSNIRSSTIGSSRDLAELGLRRPSMEMFRTNTTMSHRTPGLNLQNNVSRMGG